MRVPDRLATSAVKDRESRYGDVENHDQDQPISHLYALDLASKTTKRLTEGAFAVGRFSWSPDSQSIAFDHRISLTRDFGTRAQAVWSAWADETALLPKVGHVEYPVATCIQGGDGALGLRDADTGEAVVKLHEDLADRRPVCEDVLQDVVLGTLDVHLQQVDPDVAEFACDRRKASHLDLQSPRA